MKFLFTKYAKKQWGKIDKHKRDILHKKIKDWKDTPEIFEKNLIPCINIPPATHRVRIGNFRILIQCDFETQKHIVLKVGHRRKIYK